MQQSPIVDPRRRKSWGYQSTKSKRRLEPLRRILKPMILVSFIFSLLLVIDMFMSPTIYKEHIVKIKADFKMRNGVKILSDKDAVWTREGNKYTVEQEVAEVLEYYSDIWVEKTGLLSRPYIIYIDMDRSSSFPCGKSQNLIILLTVLLFLTTLPGMDFRKKAGYTVPIGIGSILLSVLCIYMITG